MSDQKLVQMGLGKLPLFQKREIDIDADKINLILEELGYAKIPRKRMIVKAWDQWAHSKTSLPASIQRAKEEIKDEDEQREEIIRIVEAFIKDLDMTLLATGRVVQEGKKKR